MNQPLKIFRLPWLPLDAVFDFMALEAIHNLSKCSKISYTVIQQMTRRRSYSSSIDLQFDHSYKISDEDNSEEIKGVFECDELESRYRNIHQLLDLFRPETTIFVYSTQCVESIIKSVKTLNLKLNHLFISGGAHLQDNTELYKSAMSTGKDAKSLMIHAKSPARLKYENIPKFTCDKLDIISAYWVTVDNIVDGFMDCKMVYLRDSSIPPNFLYPVLRKWFDSESKLKEMRIEFRGRIGNRCPAEEVFKDIPFTIVEEGCPSRNWLYGGYMITRSDGVEADIFWDAGRFWMCSEYRTKARIL